MNSKAVAKSFRSGEKSFHKHFCFFTFSEMKLQFFSYCNASQKVVIKVATSFNYDEINFTSNLSLKYRLGSVRPLEGLIMSKMREVGKLFHHLMSVM